MVQNVMSNSSLWLVIKRKSIQFCSHCTLHGAYYLCGHRNWLRSLWLLAISCSIGLCCFLSHMIWNKFVEDPTLTVVETTHYSTSDIPFPAVVLCDTEPVHGPHTANITNLLVLRGYNQTQISIFYDSFKSVQNPEYVPAPYLKKMHYVLDDLGFPWKKLLEILSKPCDDVVVECLWRSRRHNCSEMFKRVYTVNGYCCQFDIQYFEEHAATDTNFAAGMQISEALDITVSAVKTDHNGKVSTGFILMFVFDMKDRVTTLDSAIQLTAGVYFDVNVYLWAIDSSTYVKALDLLSRKCILDTDGIGTSFYQGCLMRLIIKRVVNICKCLPFGYKPQQLGVEDYSACTWDRLICIYQEIGKVERDVREIISLNACYQRCDYVQYETEVEIIRNHRPLKNASDTESRVTVHFSESTCMKYRREVLYTWDQMLANLGGIFGLCLGGSMVSIIELVWFFLDLFTTVIHNLVNRKTVQPKISDKNKNKVFVINQNSPKQAIKISKPKKLDMSEKRFKFVN